MGRRIVRDLKRVARAGAGAGADDAAIGLARESALALLKRSISFGHGRLAVIRLLTAVRCGADVPTMHWDYCRGLAGTSRDETLRALFRKAVSRLAAGDRHEYRGRQISRAR